MGRKKYTTEHIIAVLRESEEAFGKGMTVEAFCRSRGIPNITYYRWKREFGGMKEDQAKELRDVKSENARLKRLVADLSLDKAMLKELLEGKY